MDKYFVVLFYPYEGEWVEEYETLEEANKHYEENKDGKFFQALCIIKGQIVVGSLDD